jgi:hypothetical protein
VSFVRGVTQIDLAHTVPKLCSDAVSGTSRGSQLHGIAENKLLGHNTLSIDRDRRGPYQGTLKFGKSEERVAVAIANNAEGYRRRRLIG